MRQSAGRFIVAMVVGLMLIGSTGRAFGVAAPGLCCVCFRCVSSAVASCAAISDPNDCSGFCDALNATTCISQVVNASCSALSECQLTGAPALGTGGLTLITAALAAFGVIGLRRATRRQRA